VNEERDNQNTPEPEDLDVEQADAENVKGGTEVASARDPASGLPTGKRMHKPYVVSSEPG